MQQISQGKLKGKQQTSGASLQQYEAEVIHVAYTITPKNFPNSLMVQVFIDGFRNIKTSNFNTGKYSEE